MRPTSVTAEVAKFATAAIVSIAVVAIALGLISRKLAEEEGVRDARSYTLAVGRSAVVPVLTDGLNTSEATSVARVDAVVRKSVLSDQIVRIKIWSRDGHILYSDDPSIVGKQYPLGSDELETFETGKAAAEVSDLSKPENANDRKFKKLLEVYEPVQLPNGTPVLFEAYLTYKTVEDDQQRILRQFTPPIVGGLALLLIVQVPFALGLARRLETEQQRREAMITQTVSISEAERRHIASDLHDGVVQRLVGTSLSLRAVSASVAASGESAVAEQVERSASVLRQAVRELRSLIVAVAPPRLHEEGLASALNDLVSPLQDQGVEVTLEFKDAPASLNSNAEVLLYRAAQEAVRNIDKYANASHVTIRVSEPRRHIAQISIVDDGKGFSPQTVEARRQQGHVGLGLLSDLFQRADGTVTVHSVPGEGTSITAEVSNL